VGKERETTASEKPGAIHQPPPAKSPTKPTSKPVFVGPALGYPQLDDSQLDDAPRKRKWPLKTAKEFTAEDFTQGDLIQEDLTQEESTLAVQPLELSANHDSYSSPSYLVASNSQDIYPTEFNSEDDCSMDITSTRITTGDDVSPTSLLQRLADLRITLRFHRADLYLGIAIFVAAIALLWPAAVSPRKASLSLWDRSLVALGIAEVPVPAVHFQGDPGIEVWVDPHTALYYCPGEEPYGKTVDGRFSSQREAQMDRFQSSSRSACE
jgi:hypothetical protein